MKVLISGHTRGIGHAIANYFQSKNCEITGYSRATGHDLTLKHVQDSFVISAIFYDVVILNANLGFVNVELFYKLCNVYKNKLQKTIVVIGSHSTETTKNFAHPYQIEKLALESAAQQVQNVPGSPTIVIVRPGYVDTDSVREIKDQKKMQPVSVAKLIYNILESNQNNDYKILNILLVPQ